MVAAAAPEFVRAIVVASQKISKKKLEKVIMHSVPTTRQVTLQPNLLDRNTLQIISGIASALVILIL